jgi:hypothetical protein
MAKGPHTKATAPGNLSEVSKTKSDYDLGGSASASEADFRVTEHHGAVTFDSAGLKARQYRPIDTYEGIHRFDPDFDWEPEEERKVVRKVSTPKIIALKHRQANGN